MSQRERAGEWGERGKGGRNRGVKRCVKREKERMK